MSFASKRIIEKHHVEKPCCALCQLSGHSGFVREIEDPAKMTHTKMALVRRG